eukprot:5315279-Pleurochrysis_carterae.AAC.2
MEWCGGDCCYAPNRCGSSASALCCVGTVSCAARATRPAGDTDFMRIALPSISAPKKAKKAVKNDNAEVQARRARKRVSRLLINVAGKRNTF